MTGPFVACGSFRAFAGLVALAALGAASACGDDAPTAPTASTPTIVTELFSGSLPVAGSQFYSYAVNSAGDVAVTLASVTGANTRVASPAELRVGVGIPSGEECAVSQSTVAAPALVPHITLAQPTGIFCVRVEHLGAPREPINFAIRIVHP